MSENVLEQIDNRPKDWNIDMKEIQVSLDTGFFDKEANRTLLQDEFSKPTIDPQKGFLHKSFKNSLTTAKADISQKIRQNKPLTLAEIKIIKLDAVISDKAVYTDVNFKQNDRKKDRQVMFFVTNINPAYQQNILQKKPLINSITMENKELSPTERKVQIETILYAGQYYMQFLQNKGVLQPKYEGDKPQHLIYFNELQSKYTNGENINDEMIKFYIQQIFPDISSAGSFSQKAGDAYQGIVTILTTKEGRNAKNKNNKMIDVLYQIRQLDDAKGITYVSGDMLLDVSLKNIGTCKLQRGPESQKLNAALAQLKVLKPLPNGEFADPMVKTMYQKLKNPSKDRIVDSRKGTYLDNDIFAVLKKYNLPSKGASNQELFDLQLDLVRQVNIMKTQENKQKASIQQSIIADKVKEITAQKKQKELLKQEFIKQKIDLNNSEVQKTLAYFDQQAAMYTALLNGGSVVMETATGNKEITLKMIVDQQYISMETTLMSDILQKSTIYHILDQNSNTINFIRDIKKSGSPLTTDEKTIDMLADITGAGDYRSDKNFNTTVEVTKEVVIQVALLAISGGIANIAAKGTLLAIQSGANFLKMGSYAARVARYTNLSKTAFWSSVKMMPELFAADIIAEGSVFHLVNTTLNAPLQNLGSEEYFKTINPFSSEGAMGYLESIAFMGIMKGFGSLTTQITKELGGETLTVAQQSARIKNILIANAITLPGEVLAMQGTTVAIALSFGHEVDITPQSRAHTIALVIGLRLAHNVTSPIKKVSDNIEGKIQQNSMQQGEIKIDNIFYDKQGNVQSVKYRVIDGTGKEIDAGVASQATIDAAMKNKQAEQTKMKEKEITRINNLSQKSFKDITLQDRYDMGLKQQREYIKKNELWKDKLLSSEEVNKKKFEDLTVEEFSLLMEKIIEAKGETKLVIEQKPVEEKEVPKIEEIRIIRDKEDHGTEKIEGKGPIIEQDGEFLLKKIKTDSFDFPMKDGKVEYQKTNLDGITQQASLGEITIQQAKECFLNGLSIIADMFKGQNRAVLSSGSLFLNVESYKKLGGDIDIATDVQTFINLVLKKTNGLTELDRLVKAGTIQDLIFTKIDHTKIDITNLTDKEINDYINKGDIRVEFNIKSKDGFLINTEFFPEPQGYGLIQLGTKRTKGNIKEYTINGKKIRTVNEELAGKSYLVNLAHEIENNSLEGLSRGKKIKDSIRINNIFEHMVSLGIREPKHMIGFIEETIFDYKNQPGSDGGMCKYLEDGLLGLEKTKEIFKDITNDYNIVKENSVSRGIETTISFNNFMDRTYGIKKELLDIQKNGQNIPDKVYSEITELQQKINIKDPKSFAYYYELYQLRSNFIKPISNKL